MVLNIATPLHNYIHVQNIEVRGELTSFTCTCSRTTSIYILHSAETLKFKKMKFILYLSYYQVEHYVRAWCHSFYSTEFSIHPLCRTGAWSGCSRSLVHATPQGHPVTNPCRSAPVCRGKYSTYNVPPSQVEPKGTLLGWRDWTSLNTWKRTSTVGTGWSSWRTVRSAHGRR